jgi:hypothetical protein
MIDPNFFNKYENQFIEAIIHHIGEHVDVEVTTMLELFGIKYKTSLDHMEKLVKTTSCQCKVKLNTDKQCSRSSKTEGFCMTHYKQFINNKLDKSKIIKQTELSKFDLVVEKLRKAREIPKLVQSKLIYFNNDEYLYDPHTDFVYNFDTHEKIGKIDKFKQLKILE